MTRILKLAAAGVGTAAAVTAAALLHPRSAVRRRAGGLSIAQVRSALQAAHGDPSEAIGVRVERGVVSLRGEVDAMDDIGAYEATVRAVPGVIDVDNLLRLRLTGMARPRVLSA